MTKIPGSDKAFVHQSKIVGYLLNANHPQGASRARFFIARGFTLSNWRQFADALAGHARENDYTKMMQTRFGTIYTVQCAVRTPDGLNPCIRTVWELREDQPPRLITAHPF